MKTADVIRYFGGTQRDVAKVLGLTPGAVHAWPEIVPEFPALRLHLMTDGKLAYSAALYDRLHQRKPIPYEEIVALRKARAEVQRIRARHFERAGV